MSHRIVITQRVLENDSYVEQRDALSHDWRHFLSGILPDLLLLPLPNDPDTVEHLMDEIAITGAILSNGNDWGEAASRDVTEECLLRACRRRGTPVIGVCRGLHALNAMLGGTISRDVNAHVANDHSVTISDPSFVSMAGCANVMVNSFHHHGVMVNDLAPDCDAFAVSGDGLIEGFHHRHEPLLALQWHPERDSPCADFDRQLFNRLLTSGSWWST